MIVIPDKEIAGRATLPLYAASKRRLEGKKRKTESPQKAASR